MLVSATSLVLAGIASAVSGEVVHYPPISSNINDLEYVLTGSGSPGIYNSSKTPDKNYGMYNWCNMPHVRKREYKIPPKSYTLQYVEVIQRHHKRTPYSSNTFFKEDVEWSCSGSGATYGMTSTSRNGAGVSPVQWQVFTDPVNPFTTTIGPGFAGSTCQFPQITDQGLEDSFTHGKDIREVYWQRLGLPLFYDGNLAKVRVTHNTITSQVASGLVAGLFPLSKLHSLPALIQPSAFDSLEPRYPCPKANALRNQITAEEAWTSHLTRAASVYDKLDKVSGFPKDDTAGWHTSFDHYYDNFSAKQCHGKRFPCSQNDTSLCVTQEDVDTVYRLGNWEYSFLYRDAQPSAQYAALKYGGWFLELKSHLQAKVDGKSRVKYYHNIAHDGSVSPVLGFLQLDQMVWPGMGSEIVFELYKQKSKHFIRVLWSGQPIKTSTPLGTLDMVPLEKFFEYIDSMVGSANDLFTGCNQ